MVDIYAEGHPGASSKRTLPRQPRRKRALSSSDSSLPHLRRQIPASQITSTSLPASQNSIALSYGFLNEQLAYNVPITLPNDLIANLVLDTGAGDIWLAAPGCDGDCPSQSFDVGSSSSLNQKWNVTYFDGSASGTIYTLSSLAIGQSSLAGQAFGSASQVDTINFDKTNVTGVLGLSLPSSSAIENVLSPSSGTSNTFTTVGSTGSVLSGLWDASSGSSSTPRIISLGLERLPSDGGGRTANSSLTIGGVDSTYLPESEYSSITFQPVAATSSTGYEHWTLSLTGLSVTNATGTASSIPISFAGQKTVEPTVVLDSGSSLNYAPASMLDALYGAFVDASGNRIGPGENGIFYVPCDLPLNMTLSLSAGISVPIHPLDASFYQSYSDIGIGKDSDGCIGSFQSALSSESSAGADIILGTPFLRNVYTVFSCEPALSTNTTAAEGTECANPTVGLRPMTTDLTQAYLDFDAVRVRNEQLGDNAAFGVSYSGSSSSSSSGGLNTGARIAIGIVVSVVVIIGLFLLTLFIARRRHAREGAREDGVGSGDGVWPAEKGREGVATRSSPGGGEGDGDSSSLGADTGAEGAGSRDYDDYEGRRVSLSAKEQAQLREAALLHGFYDADLFSESPSQPGRSPSARRPARFNRGVAGPDGGADAGGAATPSGFGTESTDSRGYGEARRIQREYLRRHPSLERDRQAAQPRQGPPGSNGGGVEIEMEERGSSAAHHGEGVAR
ncbi:acid protease [Microstroma glucosiphilum]|uniref:Acid protease n=1 Tax=Pseudomicrostroma glucosiphilum TaxID=1684307 RepID=A0A316U396_9BASI|nr:acid protease [Pseudomicrostroma glucosiphilum]PWN18833.1 acid protease [Pseudomicrostroma glucosiphilum]